MQYNVLGIIAAILSVAGIVFTSSWWCVICFGVAMTLAIVSLFLGKDKLVPILALLFSLAGIYVMLEFAGLVGIIGFKPFWLKNTRIKQPQEVEETYDNGEVDKTDASTEDSYTNQIEEMEKNDSSEKSEASDAYEGEEDSVELDDMTQSALEQAGLELDGELNSESAQDLINQQMNNITGGNL